MNKTCRFCFITLLIFGWQCLAVIAQETPPAPDLLQSIERQIQGRIWIRKTETNGSLVSHVQMGSWAEEGSLKLLQKLPPITELDTSLLLDDVVPLLATFPALRKLRFASYSPDNQADAPLPGLPNLEHLEISIGSRDEGALLRSLANQPQLRHLSIWWSSRDEPVDKATRILSALKPIPLETLRTENGLGTHNLRDVAEIKSLRTLVFEYTQFKPNDLEVLASLPHLETLVIPGAKLSDADFVALSRFPSLRRIVLSDSRSLTMNRVKALARSSTLNQIESIRGGYSEDERNAFQKQFPQACFVFFGPSNNPLSDLPDAQIQPFQIVRESPLGSSRLDQRGSSYFNSYLILERAKPLSGDDAKSIHEILVDPETYNMNGGAGCFIPSLGLRFAKGEQSCDALVCLTCQSVSLIPPETHLFDEKRWCERYGGSIGEAGRQKLLKVYRDIFGEPTEGKIYLRASPEMSSEELLQTLKDYLEFELADDEESKKWAPLLSMNFTNCQFAGRHLEAIKPLVELQELRLNGTSINDDDLEFIDTKSALKILDLSGTKVTGAGVARFAKTHPEIKMISESK